MYVGPSGFDREWTVGRDEGVGEECCYSSFSAAGSVWLRAGRDEYGGAMLKLYHGATSVCSQKVRVGLEELGLPYESVLLDLQRGDQFAPSYLQLNPGAVVPTLVDNGLVVVESSLILDYLDREKGEGRLTPNGKAVKVVAAHWLLRTLEIHAAINTLTFATAARDALLSSRTPEQIAETLARMPDQVAATKRRVLLEQGLEAIFVEQALRQLRRMFCDMQAALEEGAWLAGSAFSKVDVALIAYVDRLERLGFSGFWRDEFPALQNWLAAMQVRPSYETGIAAFVDPTAAARLRESGLGHWPEIARKWSDQD